jgi:hypothetical protein
VFRGRKVQVTRLQRDRDAAVQKEEDSSMNASPTKGVERVVAAKEARERETNASGQLTAPKAAGRRETKEPCPMETAESTGARDINVPKKETAAMRRDGEPLTNAARRRRQTESETDAEEPQTDAGERPPSPVREDGRNRHR